MLQRLFPRVYEGWLIVGSSAFFVIILAASIFYGFGTIFQPMRDDFGWSAAATSLAFSLRTEVSGIAAPFIGVMVDRWGPRRTQLFGVLTVALSVFLISLTQNIWQFYGSMMLLSVGVSSCAGQVTQVAAATWFRARRARAMAFVTLGGGLAGLFVPVVAVLVEEFGWRTALRIMAVILLVTGMVPVSTVRVRPRNHPVPMDGIPLPEGASANASMHDDWGIPAGIAARTAAFLLLSLGLAAVSFGTTAMVVHQIPYLESLGVSKGVAAATVTITTLASTVGRLGFGFVADRWDKRLLFMLCGATVAAGLAAFAFVGSLLPAVVVLLVIAPGFGGTIPLRPALVADYYGTRFLGTMLGLTQFVQTLGAFLGPLVVGRLVDVTGEYEAGWLVTAGVVLASLPLFYFARPPSELQRRYRDPAGLPPR